MEVEIGKTPLLSLKGERSSYLPIHNCKTSFCHFVILSFLSFLSLPRLFYVDVEILSFRYKGGLR